ncbi:MAG: sigma-70 family RNA polymerase sigma factor [bacterium]
MEDAIAGESDKFLVEQHRRGDATALEKLLSRHGPGLFRFIMSLARQNDEAEEMFQEVWFRAINGMDKYKDERFLSWLMRIAHNLSIDRWRRTRANVVSLDDMDEETGLSMASMLISAGPDPFGHVATLDIEAQVAAALDALPLEQREVFLMRVYENMSFKEIAGIQGVSVNTVLARMQYGLSKLRLMLRDVFSKTKGTEDEL